MIVKIQRSIKTTCSEPQMLIYDKEHGYDKEGPLTPEVSALFEFDEYRFFAEARVIKGELVIGVRVPEQGW
jgi:hypothetical protein